MRRPVSCSGSAAHGQVRAKRNLRLLVLTRLDSTMGADGDEGQAKGGRRGWANSYRTSSAPMGGGG